VGIEEVLSAPRSPWLNPFVERLLGTLRRDCLDHVVALNESHLRRIVARYVSYYHDWRTHLSLPMDAPNPRIVHPPTGVGWSHFRKLAACIITTNDWQRNAGLGLAPVECTRRVFGKDNHQKSALGSTVC
jgi:Integrase core domain